MKKGEEAFCLNDFIAFTFIIGAASVFVPDLPHAQQASAYVGMKDVFVSSSAHNQKGHQRGRPPVLVWSMD
jgi:hypothetical protein